MPQNGKYHGFLIGIGVGEGKGDNAKPYLFHSWEIRYWWDDQAQQWVDLEPFQRDIMWSLNDDANTKSGRSALEYTQDKLLKMGFNGDWGNPRFDQKFYDDGIVLIASTSAQKWKGKEQQQWDLEMFAQGSGIEHKAAGQSTLTNLQAKWNRFTSATQKPSTPMPNNAPPKTSSPAPGTSAPPAQEPPTPTSPPPTGTSLTSATREQAWAVFVQLNQENDPDKQLTEKKLADTWRTAIQERYNIPEMQLTPEQWADLIANAGTYFPPF